MRALLVLCLSLTIQLVLCKDENKPTNEPDNLFPVLLRLRRDVQKLPTSNGQAATGNQGPVFKLPKFPTVKAPVITSAKPPAPGPTKSPQKPAKTPTVQAKPQAKTSVQAAAGKVPTPVVKLAGKLPTNAPSKPKANGQAKPLKPAKGHALRKPNKVKTATPAHAARKPNKGNKAKGQALRQRKNNKKKLGKNNNLRAQSQKNNKKTNNQKKNQAAGRKVKRNPAAKPGAKQAANAAAKNQAAAKKGN